jgi:hypothetical protein
MHRLLSLTTTPRVPTVDNVAGTIDFCLLYKLDPNVPNLFCTYSDADLAGNVDTGRSTTGYVVKMGTGAVSTLTRASALVRMSAAISAVGI